MHGERTPGKRHALPRAEPRVRPAGMLTSLPESAQPAPSASNEADNRLRFTANDSQGHVESLFLKGNSPDGQRALWVKYTLLAPRAHPERAVVELWAVAFDRARGAPRANKRTFPLASAQLGNEPFLLRVPAGELTHGHARGQLDAPGPTFRWDVGYDCAASSFRPFPSARMYTGAFPRTKTLTPAPDSRLTGWFEVDAERWDVSGFHAAQGHNWGRGHAHAYAWAHANALALEAESAHAERVWLELISGRVRVGPFLTPWLSCAGIAIDDRLYRFDGPRSMFSRSLRVDTRSYRFRFREQGAELEGEIEAEPLLTAGLRYEDPDGKTLSCLNSKLARGRFSLRVDGKLYRLRSERVALEIGTREEAHGVPILV